MVIYIIEHVTQSREVSCSQNIKPVSRVQWPVGCGWYVYFLFDATIFGSMVLTECLKGLKALIGVMTFSKCT